MEAAEGLGPRGEQGPDEADETFRFARKIDVFMSIEEFDKRCGTD